MWGRLIISRGMWYYAYIVHKQSECKISLTVIRKTPKKKKKEKCLSCTTVSLSRAFGISHLFISMNNVAHLMWDGKIMVSQSWPISLTQHYWQWAILWLHWLFMPSIAAQWEGDLQRRCMPGPRADLPQAHTHAEHCCTVLVPMEHT